MQRRKLITKKVKTFAYLIGLCYLLNQEKKNAKLCKKINFPSSSRPLLSKLNSLSVVKYDLEDDLVPTLMPSLSFGLQSFQQVVLLLSFSSVSKTKMKFAEN